jgi:uncharacterized protein
MKAPQTTTMLRPNLPSINDEEGAAIPEGLPMVVDAHVHVFPRDIFSAIWQWFDENAWRIRYQLTTSQVFDFMLSHGITHVIALQYAHKPGISEELNQYMAEKCRAYPHRITGLATVFPGEDGADRILQKAFDSGLAGLKLHAHVLGYHHGSDRLFSAGGSSRPWRLPVGSNHVWIRFSEHSICMGPRAQAAA